jgi:translation initiation factor 3 subunit E
MAAKYDLTNKVSPFLDRHLVLPLYQFLEAKQLYNAEDILEAKLALLEKTNVIDSYIDVYKMKMGNSEEVPSGYFF